MTAFIKALTVADAIQLLVLSVLVITLLYTVGKDIVQGYINRKRVILLSAGLTYYDLGSNKASHFCKDKKYSRLEVEIFNPSPHIIQMKTFEVKTNDGRDARTICDIYSSNNCEIKPFDVSRRHVSWLNHKLNKRDVRELIFVDYFGKNYNFGPQKLTEQVIKEIPLSEEWLHRP